jgi:hypothetical protein
MATYRKLIQTDSSLAPLNLAELRFAQRVALYGLTYSYVASKMSFLQG